MDWVIQNKSDGAFWEMDNGWGPLDEASRFDVSLIGTFLLPCDGLWVDEISAMRNLPAVTNPNTLKDCLQNCCQDYTSGDYLSGWNPATAYAKGIIVGAVTALMAVGYSFEDACRVVRSHCQEGSGPHGVFDAASIPEAWQSTF